MEAPHCRLVALNPHVTRAHGFGELVTIVDQRGQGVGIGLDGRVGSLSVPANGLKPAVGHNGSEDLLAQPKLVARIKPSTACGSNIVRKGMMKETTPAAASRGLDGERAPQPEDNRL